MAVVLVKDVPDCCPSGTLTGICFGWSFCIAISLTDTCFLMPEGGSSYKNIEPLLSTIAGP